MSDDTRYNGWTNRETWLYGLWFDSDSDSELAQQIWDDAQEGDPFFSQEERVKIRLADALKANFDEYLEQIEGASNSGIVADLLSGAVSAINWFEIAEGLLDDVSKSEPSEDSEDELEAAHETQG